MSTLVKTKRRINSVTGTRKITNAMELVASVKLKRFRDVMTSSSNYIANIKDIMMHLNRIVDQYDKDDNVKANNKRLFIILNSNLGLCAHYNNDIFKFAETLLKKDDEIIPIGLKGYTHYKNQSFKLNENFVSLNEKIDFNDVNKLACFVMNEYHSRKYSEIHIIYMQYVNTLISRAEEERLLPIPFDEDIKEDLLPPEVEPSPKELIKELEPIYLASAIYQAMVVAQVSEQAARNNAMKNATDNADEILDKLKLEYNKARQGAITQEITEVISGAGEFE
ncbi:MAG: ATP synthase F1 subunit gamma [Bacilli bacterium]|nr:ATP synthase F1 subunit gamma [Bacilli bacterium]